MVGPPKKHFVPLLLLVSLFALFFFSHYHSFLRISPANTNSNSNFISSSPNKYLSPQNNPNFTFLIKVLAFNRLDSLSRCLNSLANANYDGDNVHLHVYIDHFPSGNDSSTALDQKLDNSNGILHFVNGFNWKFGNKVVQYRTTNVGLQAQWLEAWWPSSDDEFAFVVEDDMEVSPLFYRFVKTVIVNFYYNVTTYSPSIYGISLQRPRYLFEQKKSVQLHCCEVIVDFMDLDAFHSPTFSKHGNKIQLDSGTRLFLYQLVGTWGQVLFPKPWKEFRLWYDNHKAKGIKPFLDGMVTTGWYKKMGEKIWTPWFIKFIHYSGYFNIYTNLGHERALSVSHRDAGVNYGKTAGPDSQLVDETSIDYNFLDVPPLTDLRWYDFCFREILPGRAVRSLDDFKTVLPSVQKHQTIILVSIFWTSDEITRNLLCHLERLNIQNYIFTGPRSDFLYDLARRGHPIIDANKLLYSMRAHRLITFQGSSSEVVDIIVKSYVIQKCLEYNYHSWIVDASMLFTSNDLFHKFINTSTDLYAGKSSEMLFLRSSSPARKILGDGLLKKVGTEVGEGSLPKEGRKLAFLVAKLLEESGGGVQWVDENSFGVKVSANTINKSLSEGGKVVYWSKDMDLNLVKQHLEEWGMWIIDGDSSCKAVICHQS
ncbi:uncharacterized protein [Euphorbia lathyris]|uniref:uncharacterized protein isoform X2 n=1 Tax=Euphorbia lathyris TaxID=212925 RepID=UPI0033143D32